MPGAGKVLICLISRSGFPLMRVIVIAPSEKAGHLALVRRQEC